jgi:hypothetical protein
VSGFHVLNMNKWICFALIGFAGISIDALAGEPAAAGDDLTLGNFFSAGWNQSWSLRNSLPDGAPDLPLFHAATNFLFRGARTDYYYQDNLSKTGVDNVQFLDEYIDYAINQRFMVSLFGNYTWVNHIATPDQDGAGGGIMGRFQLVDTPTASTSLNLRVDLPDKSIGVGTTKLSAAITGWQDLSPLGLGRTGLYYDIEEDGEAGNAASGVARNALGYDIGLAETWTQACAPLGNLTSFVEFSGATNMDGNQRTETQLTATPGVQFLFCKRNLVMLGVDIPVTHAAPERDVYRVSYIYCF